MGLTPPLRNFFFAHFLPAATPKPPACLRRAATPGSGSSRSGATTASRGRSPLRFGRREAQKQRKRKESFAKRNQTFRDAGREPLRSLGTKSGDFAGSFIFNELTLVSFRALSIQKAL